MRRYVGVMPLKDKGEREQEKVRTLWKERERRKEDWVGRASDFRILYLSSTRKQKSHSNLTGPV